MNFSLQDKPCSNQMADSWFPTAVISHFYSAVYASSFFHKAAAYGLLLVFCCLPKSAGARALLTLFQIPALLHPPPRHRHGVAGGCNRGRSAARIGNEFLS